MRSERLTPAEARRGLLAAQGFALPADAAAPGGAALLRMVRRLGLLQIDSVNVLARAHYLPLFSRLGPYDTGSLDLAGSRRPRRLFEYWGHEASLLPVELHPLLRWRMAESHQWRGVSSAVADHPELEDDVRAAVRDLGPVTAEELERAVVSPVTRERTQWGWNWALTKRILEHLFWSGEISSAGRDGGFRRRYELTERVLPPQILAQPTPDRPDAIRGLVRHAARALGVATTTDLQDYFRLSSLETKAAIAELVDTGELRPVEVPGWGLTWRHKSLRIPREVVAEALLVPFDPLIWDRRRVARVFGMQYRIEIYVPAAKRVHGYYVLPFLLGDRLVGRVDLKADRAGGDLLVQGAFAEPGVLDDRMEAAAVLTALARQVHAMSAWLGLGGVRVVPNGDLGAALVSAGAAT